MHPSSENNRGFTLVELLVSTALLTGLVLILVSILDQTQKTWRFTRTKVEQFSGSRAAFEGMTRRLSQATLNTYWAYEYPSNDTSKQPNRYARKSELRFLSSPMLTIPLPPTTGVTGEARSSHGVFFQAPLGFVEQSRFKGLVNLLNTWGYFVEFNSDAQLRPDFINKMGDLGPPNRNRFRLMEVMEPSTSFGIYQKVASAEKYSGRDWVSEAISPKVSSSDPAQLRTRVCAENVIALVLQPKLSLADEQSGSGGTPAPRLAPNYEYDSAPKDSPEDARWKNQLPPLIQVTMVAIDETSAARLSPGTRGNTAAPVPELGLETLFKRSADFDEDLKTLAETLVEKRLAYRIFTTHVSIRAAKWSRD